MRVIFFLFILLLGSCTEKYLHVKNIIQKNCDRYIDVNDIKVIKRDAYYVSYILKDSIYTDIYYFITYGRNWDETIMVADDNMFYWLNDSFCKDIIYVNNILRKKNVEIGEVYVNGANRFSVRARSTDRKFLHEVEDVKSIKELLNRSFKW